MIEVGNPARQFRRMMVRQQVGTRSQFHLPGSKQRLRDQKIRRGIRFPRRTEVFSDPGFIEAKAVAQLQMFEVPRKALGEGPLGWMRRHHEYSGIQTFPRSDAVSRGGSSTAARL